MNYFFHPAAEAEYLSQVAYYEEKRAGLGAYLISDFEGTMSKIMLESKMGAKEFSNGSHKLHGLSCSSW